MTSGVSNGSWPRFSRGQFVHRYGRLRDAMGEREFDALLAYGAPIHFGTDPAGPNMAYLSGYVPGRHGYVVFPRKEDPTLLVYVQDHAQNA